MNEKGEREMLHDYTVTYHLTEGQHERLKALTERFNKVMGTENTPAMLLEGMMTTGALRIIDGHMEDVEDELFLHEAHMGEGNCRECTV